MDSLERSPIQAFFEDHEALEDDLAVLRYSSKMVVQESRFRTNAQRDRSSCTRHRCSKTQITCRSGVEVSLDARTTGNGCCVTSQQ